MDDADSLTVAKFGFARAVSKVEGQTHTHPTSTKRNQTLRTTRRWASTMEPWPVLALLGSALSGHDSLPYPRPLGGNGSRARAGRVA